MATLRGVGKQVYECKTDGSNTYGLREPVAVLSTSRGTPAGIHGKGPFWANLDGSRVDGSLLASAAPKDPSRDIPWLLLKATPTGTGGVFSKVGFIQRVNTKGGVAPAACNGKQTLALDYSADYLFWAK